MIRNRLITRGPIAFAVVLAVVLALAASAAFAQEKPSVALAPDKGKAEAALKISGKGFQPNEEVDIVLILGEGLRVGLGTAKVEVVVADDKGAFEAESAVPKMAKPGEYKIEVIGSKGSEASAVLQVLPKE